MIVHLLYIGILTSFIFSAEVLIVVADDFFQNALYADAPFPLAGTRLSDNEQYNDIFMEYHIPKGRNKIQ